MIPVYTHIFDQTKKITKIEHIIHRDENCINQISFYSGRETLIKVGLDEDFVKSGGGRVEKFEIADDEQLIGCELNSIDGNFCGVTWLKIKKVL